jgi:hypothetical protein
MIHVEFHSNKMLSSRNGKSKSKLFMREEKASRRSGLLLRLPQSIYAGLEKVCDVNFGTKEKEKLPFLYPCLCQTREAHKNSMRKMRRSEIPGTSSRLQQTSFGELALSPMSFGAS